MIDCVEMCNLKKNKVIELKINREAYNLANGEYINESVNNLISVKICTSTIFLWNKIRFITPAIYYA